MIKIKILILLIICSCYRLIGQTFDNFDTKALLNSEALTKTSSSEVKQFGRNIFVQAGIGIPDLLYLSAGKNVLNNYSVAINAVLFPLAGNGEGVRLTSGLGIKFQRLFYDEVLANSIFPLDNISIEYSYGFNSSNSESIGKFQFYFGSDKIKKTGLNFCWSVGLSLITEKNKKSFILPLIRIGLINNF